MGSPGPYCSFLDTGFRPFSQSRSERGYEKRFHGLSQDSAVVFGTQERCFSRSGTERITASNWVATQTRRANQTGSTLMPMKTHVMAEERASLQGRPAFMPRGNVKRMPAQDVYGDYDPIRHAWIVPAKKFDVANKVGDLTPNRKKPVPLPQAMGDYDPIYEQKWVTPPRGSRHVDREYKPELRTKGRVPSPPIPEGTINPISHQTVVEHDPKELARKISRKEATGSVNRITWMGSDLIPVNTTDRQKLPPLAMNNNTTTLPLHSCYSDPQNMSLARPRFYFPGNNSGIKAI